MRARSLGVFLAIGSAACSPADTGESDDTGDTEDTGIPGVNPDAPIGVTDPEGNANPYAECHAVVTIGLYATDACTLGEEMMLIAFEAERDCYGWSRESDTGIAINSATRFQCWRDRLCYSQHTETLECDALVTDKEVWTDRCTEEPQGGLWTKILDGTQDCPEPDADFECPLSPARDGTEGVVAATSCE